MDIRAMLSSRIGITLLFVVLVLLTQVFYPWDEGVRLGGSDVESYEAIALAAPSVPSDKLPYHHAQRWVPPYVVGLIAKSLGVNVRDVFLLASAACLLGAILLIHASLSLIGIPSAMHAVCMALFIFSYTLRYYLIAPGMLPDTLFIFGLALTLYGLVGGSIWIVCAGVVTAGLGRQTVLLLIPGIAYFLIRGEAWVAQANAVKLRNVLVVTILSVVVYVATGRVAASFAEPSQNLDSVTALFTWIASPDFSPAELAVYVGYAIIALLIPITMIVATGYRAATSTKDFRWQGGLLGCLLMAAGIVSQPLLAGPDWTGNGNALRLSALALAPLTLALAYLQKEVATSQPMRGYESLAMIILLALGSLHYNYTWLGPRTIFVFVMMQLAIAGLLLGLSLWGSKQYRPGTRTG